MTTLLDNIYIFIYKKKSKNTKFSEKYIIPLFNFDIMRLHFKLISTKKL